MSHFSCGSIGIYPIAFQQRNIYDDLIAYKSIESTFGLDVSTYFLFSIFFRTPLEQNKLA